MKTTILPPPIMVLASMDDGVSVRREQQEQVKAYKSKYYSEEDY